MSIKKIYTDNIPLLDELVYYFKIICKDIVLKNKAEANRFETLESAKNATRYIHSKEGIAILELFDIDDDIIKQFRIPEKYKHIAKTHPSQLPEMYKKPLLKYFTEDAINNYVELNNYYRRLYGIPDVGDKGDKIPDSVVIKSEYQIDRTKYIHEMTPEEQDIVRYLGISDTILASNPEKKYLNYIGSKKINYYDARKAENFQVLFIPAAVPQEILTRLKDKLEKNRVYTLATIYSDAYRFHSDYYDNFIMILIVIQSLLDILAEMPDFIIKLDIFDIRTVKLIFQSNGIDYFPEIPFKYQLAMIKNLNTLKKYKSSYTGIVDICSIFGFKDVTVFKYYLFKDRRKDPDTGDYANVWKEDEDGNLVEDLEKNYELKFLKVPLEDDVDNYIHKEKSYEDYHEITLNDPYWDGYMDHEEVIRDLLEDEFNYVQSKYRSLSCINSLTESTFEMVHFYNMVFNDEKNFSDSLLMNLYCIDPLAKFRLTDVLCYLYALGYTTYGVKDKIMNDPAKILLVSGFNFQADMQELATYVANKGFTLEELGVSNFKIPKGQVFSFNQLMDIYTNNMHIYQHVVDQLVYAPNKRIWDIYKHIYDALYVQEVTNKFFTLPDGSIAGSYTEYLATRSSILYESLVEIKAMDNKEEQSEKIAKIISDSVYIIEQYLGSNEFKHLFTNLPTQSVQSIVHYIYKVLNFFKSFKVQFYSVDIYYKFDDRLQNKINIIDQLFMSYNYTKSDIIKIIDHIRDMKVHLTKKDMFNIIDQLSMDYSFDIDKYINEKITNKDEFKYILSHLLKTDKVTIDEVRRIIVTVIRQTIYNIVDKQQMNVYFSPKDKIKIDEKIYFEYVKTFDKYLRETITQNEKLVRTSLLYKEDMIKFDEVLTFIYTYDKE